VTCNIIDINIIFLMNFLYIDLEDVGFQKKIYCLIFKILY